MQPPPAAQTATLPRSTALAGRWLAVVAALCLALLWGWATAMAGRGAPAPVVILHDVHTPQNLARHLEILPDPTGAWTIAEVTAPSRAAGFHPLGDDNLRLLSFGPAVYWLRFRLGPVPAAARPANNWVLEFGVSYLEQAHIYTPLPPPGESGRPRYQQSAEATAGKPCLGTQFFRNTVFFLPRTYAAGEYFYIRIKASLPINASVTAYGREHLVRRSLYGAIAFGALYGIMIAMIITNLSMLVTLRDRVYLYYIFFIMAMLVYSLAFFGHIRCLVDSPPASISVILVCLVAAVHFAACLLARTYLFTKTRLPFWDKAILATMGLSLVHGLLALVGLLPAAAVMGYLPSSASPAVGVIAWFACRRRGYRPAWSFLAAWLLYLAGIIVWELRWLGLAPVDIWSDFGFVLAASLEAVLLSFALGQRVRDLRKEKEALATSERRYQKLSVTDGLTGLYNQRFFVSRLTSEVDHARRLEQPLSLIMLDVDHFKRFNDTHGHPAGDQVLTGLAAAIGDCTRPGDYCCRYGGEEFAVILPGADLEDARAVAERIRTSFTNPPYRHPDHNIPPVTVSLGLAMLRPGEDSQSLLDRADRALYRAKDLGRNRTETAP